ncbi:MAG: S41 family peptidase, partial [Bacteriovorax sp.]|nr:S41 family peptidase [Bacteriovorax sp.]
APMFQYNGQYRVTLKPFIGVELEIKNNQLTLSNIVINTAAELAGLKVGDVIVSINDGPVNINEETDVDNFFDFKDNEKVKLKILRKEREFDVTIQFSLTSKGSIVDRKIDFKGEKYSYLYMGEVPSDLGVKATCNIFSNFLKKFNAQTTGIVLDLRNNVGGPGETAACIAGLFLGTGTHIYSEVDLTNSTLKKRLAIMPKVFNKKIIVLVNGKTASSGEIIAQALQFHSRALILGDRTYGKAIGQTQQDFKIDRITYYETSEKALQPDGSSYHGRGVIPDYYVYREGLEISDREKETLREEDLAIFPLKIENGIFYKKRSTPLNFPSKCVKEDVVRKSVDSLDDRDWKKDFQLQFALETLRCL